MLGALRRKGGLRAVLAALFVYVLFGHAVLADIVSARMALGSADAIICHSEEGDSAGKGSGHSGLGHEGCAVCAFAGAAPLVPVVAALGDVSTSSHETSFVRPTTVARVSRGHDPRTSQGPPQAA